MVISPEGHRVRLAIVGVVIVSIFATLVARLWYLQVLAAPELRSRAEANPIRTLTEPAPRGRIYDAKGRIIADNRISLSVVVDLQRFEGGQDTLGRLATALATSGTDLTLADLRRRIEDPRVSPYASRTLATDVSKDVAIEIQEHPELFPGISVEARLLRSYAKGPAGALAPHIIGYLGEASPEDLKADPALRPGDIVGRGGVEQQYQEIIRGQKGVKLIEVDAQGRLVGGGPLSYAPPVRGSDITLTLDADIQNELERAFHEGIQDIRRIYDKDQLKHFLATAGGAVVLDAETGGIVASVSYPEFDLNAFNTGDDLLIRHYLDAEKSGSPLNDRVTGGLYAPGSTFKPVVAAVALEVSATATSGDSGSFPCGGSYIIPGDLSETEFHDWIPYRYGYLDLAGSIIRSCDIAFYTLGVRMEVRNPGGTMVSTLARSFGLDSYTGVDLPNEASGRVPDEKWKQKVHKENPTAFPNSDWYVGDAVNTSIGQGDVIATPLQMAVAYASIVNGGTVYRPHVLRAVADSETGQVVQKEERPVDGIVPVKPQHLRFVTESMRGVVQGEGTAAGAFYGFPVDRYVVGGKTGTAETSGGKQDTAAFIGFVGRGRPQYVVSVVVEEGGHGGSAAAPIARRVMEALMGERTDKVTITQDSGDR